MSINKLISIRNPIIDAQDTLGIDHDKDIPYFTKLATDAEKQIGSYYQYERTKKVIDVVNNIACLPNDAVLVECAMVGDHLSDANCDSNFNNILNNTISNNSVTNVNSNGLFLVVDISSNTPDSFNFNPLYYDIQNNKILFKNACNADKITIRYLKFKTDCDGFLEIGENHVNAIKWYIVWMYSFRQKAKNYIDRDLMNMAREEWNRECRHARAEDNRLTKPERDMVARMYGNPMSGRGLWQGMYTTLGTNFTIWP